MSYMMSKASVPYRRRRLQRPAFNGLHPTRAHSSPASQSRDRRRRHPHASNRVVQRKTSKNRRAGVAGLYLHSVLQCANLSQASKRRTAPMRTTNPECRITRRGFLERSSAALAGAALIGNAYTAKSVLSSENTVDSAKPDTAPLAGKIALEEHFVLAEAMDTSYAVRDLTS